MNQQSKNSQAGYAPDAYPLAALTRTLPTLAGLQAFVAVASLGSLSKAAVHLCRTQGAVSRQIQQVEAHYGCALYTRRTAGLTLTREGERLLEVALRVLTELSDYARARSEDVSTVALRLPSTFAVRWLLPRVAQLERAMPSIELRIATSSDDRPHFISTRWSCGVWSNGAAWRRSSFFLRRSRRCARPRSLHRFARLAT